VPVSGTVDQIQSAFSVFMKVYQHPAESRTFFSPDREPSIPSNLHVSRIAGLDNFSIPQATVRRPQSNESMSATVYGSGPGGSYLGSDMRAAYYGGSALNGSGQTVALVQFDGYNIGDVTASFDGAATSSTNGKNYVLQYTPTSGGTTYTIPVNNVLLDGATGSPQSGDDAEETLDIVQSVSMAPGLSQVRVYIGNLDADILNQVASDDAAQQVSISWTWSPADPDVDDFFFEEMAAQGQSVFVASGDYGAYQIDQPYFFPAEDAFVTAVGGTSLVTSGPGGTWLSETAWHQSGGGISPDFIPTPSWQTGVANSANQGSAIYRNLPDVAMEADFDNYNCDMGICQEGWAGTSFASPRWAGYLALVNQQAAEQGESSVGFLDPLLYLIGQSPAYAGTLHDTTSGNNNYYGVEPYYNAVAGYDLVTGWGSPSAGALIDDLAPPSPASFQLSASPGSLIIQPGTSQTTTISVHASGGFSGDVTLSLPALPPGVTASFSVDPVNTSSILTVTAAADAVRGSFLLLVSGSSNGQNASAYIAVDMNAPGFIVSPSQQLVWTTPGYASSTTLNIADSAGFTGTPTLAITSPLPSGVTAVLNSNPSSAKSLLTFIGDDSAPLSQTTVSVSATSGAETAAQNLFLVVTSPSFRMNIGPEETYLAQGTMVTMTVSAWPVGNYTGGAIDLSTMPLPDGVTATFSPAAIQISQSSTLTLTASASASLETFCMGVTGLSGGTSTYTAYAMIITAAPQPTFSVAPEYPYFVLPQGGTFVNTFTVTDENGFTGAALLEPPYPPGATLAINQTDPVTGSGVATYTASDTTFPALWATSGYAYVGSTPIEAIQAPIFLWILVTPTLPFSFATTSIPVSFSAGGSASTTISIAPQNGYSGTVALSATGLPNGMTATFDSNPTAGDCDLTIDADFSVAPGTYSVNVAGTAGGQTLTRTIILQVSAASSTATPTFSAGTGAYTLRFTVSISDSTPGAAIYYTTDGSTPTAGSSVYSAPISVSTSETLQAIATANGYTSAVASAAYTITSPAAPPTFTQPAGTYTAAQLVSISDAASSATIYYTTDGSTPTTNSSLASGPITISTTETLKAIATATGYSTSPVASAAYTITPPAAAVPVISSLSPAFTNAAGTSFTLTVTGSGFTSDTVVYFGETALATQFVSPTQITAQALAVYIASAGVTSVSIQTPGPGAAASNALEFEVDSASGSESAPAFASSAATVSRGSTASYPVTLSASATDVSVSCLNLPAGATCSYSSATGAVTIATATTTPPGTYYVTAVFAETAPGAASALFLVPVLLLPMAGIRRKRSCKRMCLLACLAVALMASSAAVGCASGGNSPAPVTPNPTHQVTSSGSVSITVQ
jgi:Chitobiase/beta-hexosaminidase C-terminal domain